MVIREQQNLAAPCGLYYCRSCRSYIGQRALAVALRINDIVHGTRGISPDTALRLPRCNLEIEKDQLKDQLEKEARVCAAH